MINKFKKKFSFGILLLCLLFLQGCKPKPLVISGNVAEFYHESVEQLQKENFRNASKRFDLIGIEYPTTVYAKNSIMLDAYSKYMEGKYIDAIIQTERFIRIYPADKNIDYVYYLRALSKYNDTLDPERDQSLTVSALAAFKEAIALSPHSEYSEDLRQKTVFLYNSIVSHDVNIGYFYLKTDQIIPALITYSNVLRQYPNSMFNEEVLYRMTEIYLKLGVFQEALKYAAVLGANYVDSIWYQRAYNLMRKHGYE